ncbi:MAG TPA: hypothetical protein VE866_02710 [Candidatus Binatia bacterium]|nr:hypothetical protein [Candidatus Binatia bacterium]
MQATPELAKPDSDELDPVTKVEILRSLEEPAESAPTDPAKRTSDALFAAVQASFGEPHFLTYREVRDSTGHDAERAADALALGIYRSRGREIWGFEFKISRNDWLRELAQPDKAESWFQYCDRWALVVSDANIVNEGELPPNWGLAIPRRGRLKWLVKPPALDPLPLSRHGLVALVYRAVQQEKRDEQAAYQRGLTEGIKNAATELKDLKSQRDGLLETIHQFEAAAGVSLRNYLDRADPSYGARLGKAVRILMMRHPRLSDIQLDLQRCASAMEREAAQLRERSNVIAQLVSPADCPGLGYWTNSAELIEAISGEVDLPMDYCI